MSAADGKAAMSAHAARIAAHYEHEREKHLRFACEMFPAEGGEVFAQAAKARLETWRAIVSNGISVSANSILSCEIAEVEEAYACGDKAHAVEKCYDAIAVLLRMVDVLEGRQTLGNPYAPNDATNG